METTFVTIDTNIFNMKLKLIQWKISSKCFNMFKNWDLMDIWEAIEILSLISPYHENWSLNERISERRDNFFPKEMKNWVTLEKEFNACLIEIMSLQYYHSLDTLGSNERQTCDVRCFCCWTVNRCIQNELLVSFSGITRNATRGQDFLRTEAMKISIKNWDRQVLDTGQEREVCAR